MKLNTFIRVTTQLTLASTVYATSYALADTKSVVDVLVLYTPGTASTYGGDPTTRIQQLFAVTNQIYADSGVNAEIRLARAEQINYTDDNSAETALTTLTTGSLNATAASLRSQYGADMVLLYRPYKDVHGSCGLAWVGGNGTNGDFTNPQWRNYMVAHVGITVCGDYVTAHELGHNMGLKHSRKQDGSGGTLPYALGYGVAGSFTTIMAYQSEFSVDYWTGKVYKFSSPLLTCKGVPCGVDKSASQGADAVSALNITIPQISQFSSNTVTSPLETLAKQVAEAKTNWDNAVAALNANKTSIAAKASAQNAAKASLSAAAAEAKAALADYKKALAAYTTASKNVSTIQSKIKAAEAKAGTATGAAKETATTTLNTLNTQLITATKLAADTLLSAESFRAISDAKAAKVAECTAVFNDATAALNLEKSATAALTSHVSKTKAIYDSAVKAYNALLKKR